MNKQQIRALTEYATAHPQGHAPTDDLIEALRKAQVEIGALQYRLRLAEKGKAELLAACKEFVRIATNGKHPAWASYVATIAGAGMRAAIARAEGGA